MIVYLAHPMDRANRDEIERETDKIIEQCREAGIDGVFLPNGAWKAVDISKRSNVQQINNSAILQCDLLIAYYPRDVISVGVPAEIAYAGQNHVPIIIIRDDGTCPLALANYDPWCMAESDLDDGQTLGRMIREATAKVGVIKLDLDPYSTARYDGDGPAPSAAMAGDAGFDIAYFGDEPLTIGIGERANVPSGICYAMPPGFWSLILGRSSTFAKRGLFVPPSVIDAGYRGPIFSIVWNISGQEQTIEPGERLAQIIPMELNAERIAWVKQALDQTERGVAGFGSTGL